MHAVWITIIAMSLALMAPALALADSYWDLESARANARAGGPVSEYDAELLERYGCLSGTKNSFCEKLRHRDAYRNDRAYKKRQRVAR